MVDFLTLKNKAFGLDFSDLSLKIINLKQKGNFFKLASWGETKLDSGIIKDGEIKDEEKLVSAIKEGVSKIKGEKLKTKKAIISLPESKAFLEIIKMPKMGKQELISAVPFEVENYIPLPVSDVYLDFQVLPYPDNYSPDDLNILIGAAPKSLVDPYVSCLRKADIFPYALEIESQAISRSLIKNNISPHSVLIIDFGKSRASFIIFSGYSLQFTSSIPISSDMLTEAVSKSLKVDFSKAEKMKIKYEFLSSLGSKSANKEESLTIKKISASMVPILADLASQIKKYLTYYESHASDTGCKEKKVSKIILSGRGSNLKGITDFLSSQIKIPVELGNPWANILPEPLKEVPELSFEESLGYTTALGLALRGIKDEQ